MTQPDLLQTRSEWFSVEVNRGADPIRVLRRMEAEGWTWASFALPDGRHGYRIQGRRPAHAQPIPDTFDARKRAAPNSRKKAAT